MATGPRTNITAYSAFKVRVGTSSEEANKLVGEFHIGDKTHKVDVLTLTRKGIALDVSALKDTQLQQVASDIYTIFQEEIDAAFTQAQKAGSQIGKISKVTGTDTGSRIVDPKYLGLNTATQARISDQSKQRRVAEAMTHIYKIVGEAAAATPPSHALSSRTVTPGSSTSTGMDDDGSDDGRSSISTLPGSPADSLRFHHTIAVSGKHTALQAQLAEKDKQIARLQALLDKIPVSIPPPPYVLAEASALVARIDALQEENSHLRSRCDELTREVDDLHVTNSALQRENEQLRCDLRARDATIRDLDLRNRDLQSQLTRLGDDLASKTRELEGRDYRIGELQGQVRELSRELEVCQRDRDRKTDRISTLQGQLSRVRSELRGAQSDVRSARRDLGMARTRFNREMSEARETIARLTRERDDARSSLSEAQAENRDLHHDLETTQRELAHVKDRVSILETELGSATKTIAGLREQITAAESRAGHAEGYARGLSVSMQTLQYQLQQELSRVAWLTQQLVETSSQRDWFASQAQFLSVDHARLNSLCYLLGDDNTKLRGALQQKQLELDSASREIERLRGDVEKASSSHAVLIAGISRLAGLVDSDGIADLDDAALLALAQKALDDQRSALDQRIAELEGAVTDHTRDLAGARADLDRRQTDLDRLRDKLGNASGQIGRLTRELAAARSRAETAENCLRTIVEATGVIDASSRAGNLATRAQAAVSELKAQLARVKSDLTTQQRLVATQAEQLAEKDNALADNARRIAKLTVDLDRATEARDRALASLRSAENSRDSLQHSLESARGGQRAADRRAHALSLDMNKLRKELADLGGDGLTMTSEPSPTVHRSRDMPGTGATGVEAIRARLASLEDEKRAAEEQARQLRSRVSGLESSLHAAESQVASLRDQLQSQARTHASRVVALDAQLRDVRATSESRMVELQAIRSKLGLGGTSSHDDVLLAIRTLWSENESQIQALNEARSTIEELRRDNGDLSRQLSEAAAANLRIQGDLEKLEALFEQIMNRLAGDESVEGTPDPLAKLEELQRQIATLREERAASEATMASLRKDIHDMTQASHGLLASIGIDVEGSRGSSGLGHDDDEGVDGDMEISSPTTDFVAAMQAAASKIQSLESANRRLASQVNSLGDEILRQTELVATTARALQESDSQLELLRAALSRIEGGRTSGLSSTGAPLTAEALVKQIDDLVAAKEAVQGEHVAARTRIDDLERELGEVRQQLRRTGGHLQSSEAQLMVQTALNKDLQGRLQRYKSLFGSFAKRLREKDTEIQELTSRIQTLSKAESDHTQEIALLNVRLASVQSASKADKDELARQKTIIDEALRALGLDVDGPDVEPGSLASEIASLVEAIQQLPTDGATDAASDHTADVSTSPLARLAQITSTLETQEKALSSQGSALAALRTDNERLSSTLSRTQAELLSSRSRIEGLTQDNTELRGSVRELTTQLAAARRDISNKEEALGRNAQEFIRLRQMLSAATTGSPVASDIVPPTGQTVGDIESQIRALIQQRDELKSSYDQATQRLEDCTRDLEAEREKYEAAHRGLQHATQELRQEKLRVEGLEAKVTRLEKYQGLFQLVMQQLRGSRKEVKSLKDELLAQGAENESNALEIARLTAAWEAATSRSSDLTREAAEQQMAMRSIYEALGKEWTPIPLTVASLAADIQALRDQLADVSRVRAEDQRAALETLAAMASRADELELKLRGANVALGEAQGALTTLQRLSAAAGVSHASEVAGLREALARAETLAAEREREVERVTGELTGLQASLLSVSADFEPTGLGPDDGNASDISSISLVTEPADISHTAASKANPLEALKGILEQQKRTLEDKESSIQDLTLDNRRLQEELSAAQAAAGNSRAMRVEIQLLKGSVATLTQDLDLAREKMGRDELTIDAQAKGLASQTKLLQTLREQLRNAKATLGEQRETIEGLNEELTSLRELPEKTAAQASRIASLEETLSITDSALRSSQARVLATERRIAELETTIVDHEATIGRLTRDLEKAGLENFQLRSELTTLRESFRLAQDNIKSLTVAQNVTDLRIASLEDQLRVATGRGDTSEKDKTRLASELEEARSQFASLQSELAIEQGKLLQIHTTLIGHVGEGVGDARVIDPVAGVAGLLEELKSTHEALNLSTGENTLLRTELSALGDRLRLAEESSARAASTLQEVTSARDRALEESHRLQGLLDNTTEETRRAKADLEKQLAQAIQRAQGLDARSGRLSDELGEKSREIEAISIAMKKLIGRSDLNPATQELLRGLASQKIARQMTQVADLLATSEASCTRSEEDRRLALLRVKELEGQLAVAASGKAVAEGRCGELSTRISHLEADLHGLREVETNYTRVAAQLEAAKRELHTLRQQQLEQTESTAEALKTRDDSLEALEGRIRELNRTLIDHEQAIRGFYDPEDQARPINELLDGLHADLAEKTEALDAAQTENLASRRELEEARLQITRLEEGLSALSQEHLATVRGRDEATAQLAALSLAHGELRRDYEGLRRDIEVGRSDLSSLRSQHDALDKDYRAAQAKIRELESSAGASAEAIRQVSKARDDAHGALTLATEALRAKETQLRNYGARLGLSPDVDVAVLESTLTEALIRLSEQATQIEEYEALIQGITAEKTTLLRDVDGYRSQLSRQQREMEGLRSDLAAATENLRVSAQGRSSASAEADTLRERVSSLRDELRIKTKAYEDLSATLSVKTSEIASRDARIHDVETDMATLQAILGKQELKIRELTPLAERVPGLEGQVTDLTATVATEHARAEALAQDKLRLDAEVSRLGEGVAGLIGELMASKEREVPTPIHIHMAKAISHHELVRQIETLSAARPKEGHKKFDPSKLPDHVLAGSMEAICSLHSTLTALCREQLELALDEPQPMLDSYKDTILRLMVIVGNAEGYDPDNPDALLERARAQFVVWGRQGPDAAGQWLHETTLGQQVLAAMSMNPAVASTLWVGPIEVAKVVHTLKDPDGNYNLQALQSMMATSSTKTGTRRIIEQAIREALTRIFGDSTSTDAPCVLVSGGGRRIVERGTIKNLFDYLTSDEGHQRLIKSSSGLGESEFTAAIARGWSQLSTALDGALDIEAITRDVELECPEMDLTLPNAIYAKLDTYRTLAQVMSESVATLHREGKPITEARSEKRAQLEIAIESYLSDLGFAYTPAGAASGDKLCAVAELTQYVREFGDIPPALDNILRGGAGSPFNGEAKWILVQFLYLYTACSPRCKDQFPDSATIDDLSWLHSPQNLSSDKARVLMGLMKAIAHDAALTGQSLSPTEVAMGRTVPAHSYALRPEQARWGENVDNLLKGEKAYDVYAEGGSGKTTVVKFFLQHLKAKDKPVLFLSPFAIAKKDSAGMQVGLIHAVDGELIYNVELPPGGKLDDMVVVVDEAHLLRPSARIILRSAGQEREVNSFLKMTATPITSGFDLKAVAASTIDGIRENMGDLKAARMQLETAQAEAMRDYQWIDELAQLKAFMSQFSPDTWVDQLPKTYSTLKRFGYEAGRQALLDATHQLARAFSNPATTAANLQEKYAALVAAAKHPAMLAAWKNSGFWSGGQRAIGAPVTMTPDACTQIQCLLWRMGAMPSFTKLDDPEDRDFLTTRAKEAACATYQRQQRPLARLAQAASVVLKDGRSALGKCYQEISAGTRTIQDNIAGIKGVEASLSRDLEEARTLARASGGEAMQSLHARTAERRKAELDNMEVVVSSAALIRTEAFRAIQRTIASLPSAPSRLQVILPHLRMDVDLLGQLKGLTVGGRPPIIVFHDSMTDENGSTYGTDQAWIDGAFHSLQETVTDRVDGRIKTYEQLIFDRSQTAPPAPVVMLYDFTNKQGGDFGILSNATPGSDIQQLVFLNIQDRRDGARVAGNESDLYQALRRRRGTDGAGIEHFCKPKVFTSESSSTSLRRQLADQQQAFEKMWREREKTEVVSSKAIKSIHALRAAYRASPDQDPPEIIQAIAAEFTRDTSPITVARIDRITSMCTLALASLSNVRRADSTESTSARRGTSLHGRAVDMKKWREEVFQDVAYAHVSKILGHMREAKAYIEQTEDESPAPVDAPPPARGIRRVAK